MYRFRRFAMASLLCAAVVVGAVLSGCSRQSEPPENPTPTHLRNILQAYDMALYKGRPPQSAEDLKPYLKQLNPDEDPEVTLRSPNDGEPYEIIWGVRLDNESDIGAIVAYEKKGANGKRYVITVARLVKEMTDAEFQQATFVRGKRPGNVNK